MTRFDSTIETLRHRDLVLQNMQKIIAAVNKIKNPEYIKAEDANIANFAAGLAIYSEVEECFSTIIAHTNTFATSRKRLYTSHFFNSELLKRGLDHDFSKLKNPILRVLNEAGPRKRMVFGGQAYDNVLSEDLKGVMGLHYELELSHPEHHENGIYDMNLVTFTEAFCDWAATNEEYGDGDLHNSIDICTERFGIDPVLSKICHNSVSIIRS